MSVIDQGQGAIKQSEVAVDSALPLLGTAVREDGMTVAQQIASVLSDSLRRAGMLLTSRNAVALNPGAISWTGTSISFVLNTDIMIKMLQNAAPDAVVNLKMAYGATDTATTFNTLPLASGEILYVELDRANITGATVILENAVSGGSLAAGKTVKKGTSLPNLASPQSGPQGTITIPLAINIDGALWWIPHGIYWPAGTSSPLGAVVTTTTIPVGGQLALTTFGISQAYGYSTTKSLAPGFQLCDGSVIIDPQSPHFNPTRNPDGTPTLSYNPALDVFTPNSNGEHVAWSNAVTWNEGDYVINAGTRYVAIQFVPTLIAITNTAYWQTEATYNNTSPANPYNKYRKTTQNQGNNTYPRGNNQSFAASNQSAYGGANSKVISGAQLPPHTHTFSGTTGNDSPDHTHLGDRPTDPNGNHGDDPAGFDRVHSVNIPSAGANVRHQHPFSGTTASAGSGSAFNVEPNFHNSLWIVRVY